MRLQVFNRLLISNGEIFFEGVDGSTDSVMESYFFEIAGFKMTHDQKW